MKRQQLHHALILLGALGLLALPGCSDDGGGASESNNGATSNGTGDTGSNSTSATSNSTSFAEGDTDLVEYDCQDSAWAPGDAADVTIDETPCESAQHVPEPVEIPYTDNPATCGAHRPQWGKWGEYEFLPPQRYIHNLEHGGIAFLYHPCADSSLVDEMRAFAKARAPDDGGDFRWVLTPSPDLPTAFAVLAWGHRFMANGFDEAEVEAFVSDNYRQATEDVSGDGGYDRLWIGK